MTDENQDHDGFRNLWGEVWLTTKGRRGRPPFEWSKENSNKISMLLAAGWSNERIAAVVIDPRTGKSISVPTLKRHFRSELQVRDAARDRLIAERLVRVWEQAQRGNVGAERYFGQLLEKNDQMEADRSFAKKQKEAAQPKVGKKIVDAQRALDADDALMAELELEARNARHN